MIPSISTAEYAIVQLDGPMHEFACFLIAAEVKLTRHTMIMFLDRDGAREMTADPSSYGLTTEEASIRVARVNHQPRQDMKYLQPRSSIPWSPDLGNETHTPIRPTAQGIFSR